LKTRFAFEHPIEGDDSSRAGGAGLLTNQIVRELAAAPAIRRQCPLHDARVADDDQFRAKQLLERAGDLGARQVRPPREDPHQLADDHIRDPERRLIASSVDEHALGRARLPCVVVQAPAEGIPDDDGFHPLMAQGK
jgi:hypothetical protein